MNSNVSGSGVEEAAEVKKSIAIFAYKQRLLSIEMKTKLVQQKRMSESQTKAGNQKKIDNLKI